MPATPDRLLDVGGEQHIILGYQDRQRRRSCRQIHARLPLRLPMITLGYRTAACNEIPRESGDKSMLRRITAAQEWSAPAENVILLLRRLAPHESGQAA